MPADPNKNKTKPTTKKSGPPPIPTPPPTTSKKSGYISPVPNLIQLGRGDQGQDYKGEVGSSVVAIGNARIDYVGPASGFGQMIVYTLTSGKAAGTRIYVGHAQPVAGLKAGQTINQGGAVATLLQNPLGNATVPGWTEVGIADDSALRPKYGLNSGGVVFKQLLGQQLSPAEKTQVKVAQAESDASSQALAAADASKAASLAIAKQEIHYGDPWVTIQRNKKTGDITFGTAITPNPPKNVLTFGGQPLTKSDLSGIWTSRYQDVYDQFTQSGKTPTAAQMVDILKLGLSPYGLRDYLAKQKGFENSVAYKANAGGLQSVAQQVIGQNAPQSIVNTAIAEGWDQNTFAAALRKLPQYLQGPEYQTNVAQMKTVYQQIYGTPNADAQQSINEAAASGWSTDQFANYLRTDPAYKTSLEYQANSVSFLDAMGLLVGGRANLNPGVTQPGASGTTVPNSPTVPGTPKPLSGTLPFTPTLSKPVP